jgi:phage tail sheath protein FI
MPAALTYPGVYIEEIPSGVRTITGVSTSVTAFIGRARRGPVNEPKTINNFGDFERIFGGLWLKSTMSYAVRDFYLNGGSQAVIVRLATSSATAAELTMPAEGESLSLSAANVGVWGNSITALVNHNTKDPEIMTLFNLILSDGKTTEEYLNVSVDPNEARYISNVLEQRSQIARVSEGKTIPSKRPDKTIKPDNTINPVKATGGNDGDNLTSSEASGSRGDKTGIYALEKTDLFNILCIPPYKDDGNVDKPLISDASTYCEERRAMLLVDSPSEWVSKDSAINGILAGVGTTGKNAALFFPRLIQPNSLRDNQMEEFAPCGAVAGVFARTDTQRGIWKAPAGLDAALVGVPQLSVSLTDAENGELNPLGINCLRAMPASGRVVWGSRTLQGNDRLASEWKYIPVRRTALYIEESLYRGTQWVVFEPNDEPLWAQIRLNVGAFMHSLFRQGAFQGTSPRDAYFVKCDKETTTQNDIDRGIVNIMVGFAPLKPAEFVVIKIQQIAGEIQT